MIHYCAEELKALGAPQRIIDAGAECDKYKQANLRPPSELVSLIRSWVYKGQNRYGK